MFTLDEITAALAKVRSGKDFPEYIREIRKIGVIAFETRVKDNQTIYYGSDHYELFSPPLHEDLHIAAESNKESFLNNLKAHQSGETDYFRFCKDCARSGIEKWVVELRQLTCTYYDSDGNAIFCESIPE
ncbi:phage envelope protein [Robertkochia solimangrovi]|nr:phage envelope protein [Robertkochia solimangrovi]